MIAALMVAAAQSAKPSEELLEYRAWLVTLGGPLEFGLELSRNGDAHWKGFLINGVERIEIPHVEVGEEELLLDMPHYDSRIRASFSQPTRAALTGSWEKLRGPQNTAHLEFYASRTKVELWNQLTEMEGPRERSVSGRWAVHFENDEQPAVAVLEQKGTRVLGTFLTETGDYRYLAGKADTAEYQGVASKLTRLSLACFDGAHAFLFEATLQDGTLKGDFWSGNWHHETWTAKRDDQAELADPFAQTKWNGSTKLADLAFPDLDGKKRSLGEFAGKATLLVVFGSWCPNCNDEAELLRELDAKYKERGLRILGLAFELTGEPARDAEQVRIFAKRHGLALPFFLCGTADKDEATKALGLVDRVRAFPTTVFVGADGLPKAIHSGFAGPATGEEHQKLRRDFEARIEALLAAPAPR